MSSKEQEVATQAPSPAPVTVTLLEEPKESTLAGLLTGNRSSANGMALNCITPKLVEGNLVAKLEKSELEKEALKWKCALIISVIGEKPGYNYMRRYINQTWNTVSMRDLYYHDDGHFIVKFQSMADMKEIMCSGPYTVNNRPMIMKQWTPQFDFGSELLI